jgi:Uma2 family endonuclease
MVTSDKAVKKTYTLEEFWDLPEPADHSKLELIAGVLYMTPPPGSKHDTTVSRLIRKITEYLIKSGLQGSLHVPRAAIWTSANTYLEPDLFYISQETEAALDPDWRTTADLVIEVVSPGSTKYDRGIKAEAFAGLGVKELWLVEEEGREIEVRYLEGKTFGKTRRFAGGDVLESRILPELVLEIANLFKR